MDNNVTIFTNRQESVTGDDDDSKTVDHDEGRGGSARIGSSIAERRAATCGFKAEKISTARFRASTSPFGSPSPRWPYLTIPAGISPTALLDSPIMLPNAQASPTTGTFHSLDGQVLSHIKGDRDSNKVSSLTFKTQNMDSRPSFSSIEDQISSSFNLVQETTSRSFAEDLVADVGILNNIVNDNANSGFHPSELGSDRTSMQKEPIHWHNVRTNLLECDQKGTNTAMGTARTSEDGYNWRKYGQKQVKVSEYPRSYYKCSHPNCQVKKKVERSLDGQITEIIYKGAHNHSKPQPCRRPSLGSTLSSEELSENAEGSGTCVKVEGGLIWRNAQAGTKCWVWTSYFGGGPNMFILVKTGSSK